MIDLHTHVLAGLDDGARSLEESVAIARAAVEDGIRAIAATPHVRADYPTNAAEMEDRVAELRIELAARSIPLEVLTGGEIALDRLDDLSAGDLKRFGLGGNAGYVLLEFPYYGWPLGLADVIFRLGTHGVTAVLAHPERNADVQESPERLRSLVELGALVQLTAASLDGRFGRSSRGASLELLRLGLVHLVASDAHSPSVRALGFADAAAALRDGQLARWLMSDVPSAIVAGTPLPPRPPARSGLRNRFRRG